MEEADIIIFVVDGLTGPGGFDVTIPGGGAWTVNTPQTRWRYRDPAGTLGGITRVVLRDKSARAPGLVRWVVKGKTAGTIVLPDPAGVRGTLVVGGACAAHVWNPATGSRPRCEGNAARLTCR